MYNPCFTWWATRGGIYSPTESFCEKRDRRLDIQACEGVIRPKISALHIEYETWHDFEEYEISEMCEEQVVY